MRHWLLLGSLIFCLSRRSSEAFTCSTPRCGRGFSPVTATTCPFTKTRDEKTRRISTLRHKEALFPWALYLSARDGEDEVDLEYLKEELTKYLEKRKEIGADRLAKENVGKVVGGTKGNVVLNYVSGAPNKPIVVDSPPNALDYDELTKYGYGYLITPIMKAGGRLAMYRLLGLEAPKVKAQPKKSAPKLVIDRTGETDQARYSGLKLGQVLDDNVQAEALQEAERKARSGESLRPKLEEEDYVQPFADKRNVGPKQVPDWTPQRLDEWGKKQGRAQAWARRASRGEFVSDPMETLELELQQRAYSILTGLMVATAFGRATPTFLEQFILHSDGSAGGSNSAAMQSLLELLQVPASALLLASLGSAVFCSLAAAGKNRNQAVWAVKGLLGGPLTVSLLRSLPDLVTRGEQEEQRKHQEEALSKQ